LKDWFQEQIVGPVREVAKNIGPERSSGWSSCRKKHITKNNFCAVCGTKKSLQVHHIVPFHLRPDLELEESNLITLCLKDHFLFGHLRDWKSWNSAVDVDANNWLSRIKERPYKTKE